MGFRTIYFQVNCQLVKRATKAVLGAQLTIHLVSSWGIEGLTVQEVGGVSSSWTLLHEADSIQSVGLFPLRSCQKLSQIK